MKSKSGTVLAIDPGTEKIGIAVLDKNASILEKSILKMDDYTPEKIESLIISFRPDAIVVGDGTGNKKILSILDGLKGISCEIQLVDEKRTTVDARKGYLARFPAAKRFFLLVGYILGFSRLEIDDEVAVILAKRFLSNP